MCAAVAWVDQETDILVAHNPARGYVDGGKGCESSAQLAATVRLTFTATFTPRKEGPVRKAAFRTQRCVAPAFARED